jgi:hypothetical protein
MIQLVFLSLFVRFFLGMKELFRLMIDPPHDELLPILSSVFSYLLDDESTRQYVLVPHDVKVLLAPLTDTFQIDEPMQQQQQQQGLFSFFKSTKILFSHFDDYICL